MRSAHTNEANQPSNNQANNQSFNQAVSQPHNVNLQTAASLASKTKPNTKRPNDQLNNQAFNPTIKRPRPERAVLDPVILVDENRRATPIGQS
jgi:hypothetical protein